MTEALAEYKTEEKRSSQEIMDTFGDPYVVDADLEGPPDAMTLPQYIVYLHGAQAKTRDLIETERFFEKALEARMLTEIVGGNEGQRRAQLVLRKETDETYLKCIWEQRRLGFRLSLLEARTWVEKAMVRDALGISRISNWDPESAP